MSNSYCGSEANQIRKHGVKKKVKPQDCIYRPDPDSAGSVLGHAWQTPIGLVSLNFKTLFDVNWLCLVTLEVPEVFGEGHCLYHLSSTHHKESKMKQDVIETQTFRIDLIGFT